MEKHFEKVFESERMDFIKLSLDLVDQYMKMVNDPEVSSMISPGHEVKYDEESEREWVKESLEKNNLVYSMIEKSTGDFIGNIEIKNPSNNVGEIGIVITPAKQNMHYGTEAMKALIDYAVAELGFKEFFLIVHPTNQRAIHCYKNVGFVISKTDEVKEEIYMTYEVK